MVGKFNKHLAHVNGRIECVGLRGAHGDMQYRTLQRGELLAQLQGVGQHRLLDARKAVVPHARALGLELARQRALA